MTEEKAKECPNCGISTLADPCPVCDWSKAEKRIVTEPAEEVVVEPIT